MTMIMRHGGGSHYIRPDRVYRTGVVSPSYGYQPEADVMSVAEAFTVGPYQFQQYANSGMAGYGLRAAGPGFFKGLVLKIKAKIAAKNAAKMMAVTRGMNGLGHVNPFQQAMMLGPMVVPAMSGRVEALMQMATARMPDQMATPVGAAVMNNWNSLRYGRP